MTSTQGAGVNASLPATSACPWADRSRGLMEKLVEQQVTGLCDLIEITPARLEDWDIRTIRTLLIGKAGRRERNRFFAI